MLRIDSINLSATAAAADIQNASWFLDIDLQRTVLICPTPLCCGCCGAVCVSPGDVTELKCPAGQTFSQEELTKALEEHKPAVLFLCQVRGIR